MTVRAFLAWVILSVAGCGRYGFAEVDATIRSPALSTFANARVLSSAQLRFPAMVSPGNDRFLIVAIGLGSQCTDPSVPTITGVTYAGEPLAVLAAIVGTPCNARATRLEQWQLAAPPMGVNDVVIDLSGGAQSIEAGMIAFTGVDQGAPVRASMTGTGAGITANIVVPSALDDLVVSFVGQGDSIVSAGSGQTMVFINNGSSGDTLDSLAASTAPAIQSMTSMDWTFGYGDEWQMIACALRPR